MVFSILTTNDISFTNYHHNDGDDGRAVDHVYGGVDRQGFGCGIFYDEDMVALYDETGSPI